MNYEMSSGCTPDKCDGCSGCGGQTIEKITIRVEWKHKGRTPENATEIGEIINALSGELLVSGVELIYINNTFETDIQDDSSAFFINGHSLSGLVDLSSSEPVNQEQLRKGIFQALLRNL